MCASRALSLYFDTWAIVYFIFYRIVIVNFIWRVNKPLMFICYVCVNLDGQPLRRWWRSILVDLPQFWLLSRQFAHLTPPHHSRFDWRATVLQFVPSIWNSICWCYRNIVNDSKQAGHANHPHSVYGWYGCMHRKISINYISFLWLQASALITRRSSNIAEMHDWGLFRIATETCAV